MDIGAIISCMAEPWQGRASAGKQFLTELWPLSLLTFLQDQFASEDFFPGLFFSSVSLPSAREKIQFWSDPNSSSYL